MEKLADLAELSACLAQRPTRDHYLIELVDYASPEGYFRKYRFIFDGDEILPYHLAIGSRWMVHHDSTGMADWSWMQSEEAAFLADPRMVFDAAQYRALREIRERIGLDISASIARLVRTAISWFEVNASMLVHDSNPNFPYKTPAVLAIKSAFAGMLAERADKARSRESLFVGQITSHPQNPVNNF